MCMLVHMYIYLYPSGIEAEQEGGRAGNGMDAHSAAYTQAVRWKLVLAGDGGVLAYVSHDRHLPGGVRDYNAERCRRALGSRPVIPR